MKRSEVNGLLRAAEDCFARHGWHLPPRPRWDVTDFGLGDHQRFGLVLVNLASEPEYCEKLMYARRGMTTPCHKHARKKEDIICRAGAFTIRIWAGHPEHGATAPLSVKVDGEPTVVAPGAPLTLSAGRRVTIEPGVYHEFFADSDECILGEVSTANDDAHDNFFVRKDVGRFPDIIEDEPPVHRLVSDPAS